MADDIVDFDDLEDFDYTDLDINPADLDIENLERELGLVNDDAKKESTPLAKTSSDFPAAKSQTGAPEKKEPEDQMAAKASSSSAAATGTTTATTSTVTPSLQTKQAPAAIASPNTKSSQGPSVRSQTVQKPSNGGSMGSLSPRKPGGAPRPNNNFQGAGGIMYPMPPANMVPMGQYPFAQGMMGMKYVSISLLPTSI
ncbi:hypothetical protein BX666DRAFT_67039 [Dichotomocladium elegans]|nr:hypothetical protein BX666DRAFT_67039 [Dichotomocladium elegans]